MVTGASGRGKEPEARVAGRPLFENGPGAQIDLAPFFEFEVDARPGAQPVTGLQSIQRGGKKVGGKRRIEEDDVPLTDGLARRERALLRRAPQELERRMPANGAVHRAEPLRVPVQHLDGFAAVVDQHGATRAAGKRLETERAATGKEIQAVAALDVTGQPVEQGLPHAAERRAHGGIAGQLQLSPFPQTADNAYFVSSLQKLEFPVCDEKVRPRRANPGLMLSESATKNEGAFWQRLKSGLSKTRGRLAEGVGDLLLGEREIDADVMEELETALLLTDVGVDATSQIMDALSARVKRRELNDTAALHGALAGLLKERLADLQKPFEVRASRPSVVFFVGVNGAGKTTTIGKMARRLKDQGKSVLLAAGDTFRAAAVEQLQAWGERNGVAVIAQSQGADSASVIYDAVEAARARGIDVLLADTAGRLQARANLMEELKKIRRVVERLDASAPHEVLLVLDAGSGQNALSQVTEFDAAVGVTGFVITKLDGSARAGVIFAIAEQLRRAGKTIPVYFIGVGEGLEDLRPFDAGAFVDALLALD